MAHARTTDKDARLIAQLATGKYLRYIAEVPFIVAEDRAAIDTESHFLADVIGSAGAANKAVFIAPCACKVVRVYANALAFVDNAAGGSTSAIFYKAVIGDTDVALNSALAIGAATVPTAETAIDGTLSTTSSDLDLIEGQLVYVTVTNSAHAVDARTDGLVLGLEWYPTDTSYAGS